MSERWNEEKQENNLSVDEMCTTCRTKAIACAHMTDAIRYDDY